MSSQISIQSYSPVILIVDDNPQNLQVLGKILLENNYKLEFSTSGEAALKWLTTKQFDLILLDINMPGMNGFEVCSKIRANPEMNNVPIIFLSADTERESILKGFGLGAQDYVTKPFDSRELLVRVRTHLKLKDSLEKLEQFNKLLEEKVIERTQQLKEANEKLESSNLKLRDLDKAKTGFLSLISHEIRTPLNGISGPLELLKGNIFISEISGLIDILDISVRRLEKFTLDALLITRLKTKQHETKKDKVNLTNLINELLDEKVEYFSAGNIQFKRNYNTARCIIAGETGLIKKCCGNILDNALRFTPKSGIIEIDIYHEDQYVVCEIKDSGKGFKQGAEDRVFELFTTDDDYRDACIGIGLPIARMIMEEFGGNIVIGNNPGGGASVRLQFQNCNAG
jgi:two-component system, sensor histidine kinase and response regulator